MEGLVKGMLKTVSASDPAAGEEGAAQVTLDSQAAMQKLCMWQLVTGFNLREVRLRSFLWCSTSRTDPPTHPSSHHPIIRRENGTCSWKSRKPCGSSSMGRVRLTLTTLKQRQNE